MRVLVALLSVNFAGTERHALELANALSHHCDVALLLRKRPREVHRQAAYDALLASISPGMRVFYASRAMPVLGLWRALARFRPDLIHAHHERAARIASRHAFGVPVLATLHMHFRARDFSRCDGLICLTEAAAATLPSDYAGERFVIGNWVVPQPRPTAQALRSLRDAIGIRPDDYVIGTVARLERVKGVDGLIAAFHAAALPESRLVIVGQGSQQPALAALAQRLGITARVVFTGFRADVRALYSLFDLFVLNSADEPYGLAILEAAAAGVPVVATATVGATAIARHLPLRLVPLAGQSDPAPSVPAPLRSAPFSDAPPNFAPPGPLPPSSVPPDSAPPVPLQLGLPAIALPSRQEPADPAQPSLVQSLLDAWSSRQPPPMMDLREFAVERRVTENLAAYRQVTAKAAPRARGRNRSHPVAAEAPACGSDTCAWPPGNDRGAPAVHRHQAAAALDPVDDA